AALPMANVGPGRLDRDTLAQLRAPWRCPLAFPQLRHQGFSGRHANATPRRTGRATLTQRAARTGGRWQLACPAWLAGHDHATRTLQCPALPSQMQGALGNRRSWMPWPRFAANGQRLTPLLPQRARQGRSVDVPCGQRALLGGPVGFDRLCHTGLRHLGWRPAYRNKPPTVQSAPPRACVASHAQTPALATV